MRWIDPINCPICRGKTEMTALVEPTAEERKDASRVELHKCVDGGCGGSRRFARYTKSSKLLYTREGRCGEFQTTIKSLGANDSRRVGAALLLFLASSGVESTICLERVGGQVLTRTDDLVPITSGQSTGPLHSNTGFTLIHGESCKRRLRAERQ